MTLKETLTLHKTSCVVDADIYRLGGICLSLITMDEGEPYAVATIWMEGLKETEVAIKDYSKNEGVLTALLKAGIVQLPHRYIENSYVSIPVCNLSPGVNEQLKGLLKPVNQN